MPRIAVKICGLTDDAAVDAAVAGGAGFAGFVVHPRSPRHVELARAGELARRLPGDVIPVVVVVDPDDALVHAVATLLPHAAIQLHGTETPARAAAIGASTGALPWRAIGVRTRADVAAAATYRGIVDRIVFDAEPPPGAAIPGGLGVRFDWRVLSDARVDMPWLLSGGLDASNVAEAIATTRATGVDVSSGVERAPGVKDVDKIAAFLKAANQS